MTQSQYLDRVVTNNLFCKFVGTPDEVRVWIMQNDPVKLDIFHMVFVGGKGPHAPITIAEYLNREEKIAS